MDLNVLTSQPIQVWSAKFKKRVYPYHSIDALGTQRLDGGFSVAVWRGVTLAQLNPVWYTGDFGIAETNPVFSVRFNLQGDTVTRVILSRTQWIVRNTLYVSGSEEDISNAKAFLQSPYGQQLEDFAQSARWFLRIPSQSGTERKTFISRLTQIEEACNLIYTRVVLLYFIQNRIPQVRLAPNGKYAIWTGWPQRGTGQIFQATAVLRRKVSQVNMRILHDALDGRVRGKYWIRSQLDAE